MPKSSRPKWVLRLVLIGASAWAIPALGQNSPTPAPNAGASRSASLPSVRIGAIDMEKVFKDYKKVEFTSNQLKADATSRQGELAKIGNQMQQIAKEMEGLAPNSNDFTGKESQLTELKIKLETEREKAQAEFARREAQALAQIYREIQDVSAAVAKANGMHYIVKVSNEPVSGDEPNSVMAAMAHSVIYSDPSLDITSVVVQVLNKKYEATGGAPADAATQPASATQTQAQPAARPTAAPAGGR